MASRAYEASKDCHKRKIKGKLKITPPTTTTAAAAAAAATTTFFVWQNDWC
jgi:hypothetical protein